MRKAHVIRLTLPLLAVLSGGAAGAAASRTVTVSVEFLTDGRCTVSAAGQEFHSTLTYLPESASEKVDGFRCAVPPVPPERPLELVVTLAAGARPSGRGTPRLDWVEKDGRWVGMTALSAAPEVIVVEDWHGRRATIDRRVQRGAIGVVAVALAVVAFRRLRRRPLTRSL